MDVSDRSFDLTSRLGFKIYENDVKWRWIRHYFLSNPGWSNEETSQLYLSSRFALQTKGSLMNRAPWVSRSLCLRIVDIRFRGDLL